MSLFLIFIGQFFNVFLLGLNSQFVRDRKVALCFCVSWGISTSQFIYTYTVANLTEPFLGFIAAGFGGALGICLSIYFYTWLRTTRLGKKIWKE
jgi:hypothetical protein